MFCGSLGFIVLVVNIGYIIGFEYIWMMGLGFFVDNICVVGWRVDIYSFGSMFI